MLGFKEGDAHVIRNAGGRTTDDAIRSLVISHKLLGTREWFVIHHTDCGMQLFTDDVMGELLEGSLVTATVDQDGWHNPPATGSAPGCGSVHGRFIKWQTFTDLAGSVIEDVHASAPIHWSTQPPRSTVTSTTCTLAG